MLSASATTSGTPYRSKEKYTLFADLGEEAQSALSNDPKSMAVPVSWRSFMRETAERTRRDLKRYDDKEQLGNTKHSYGAEFCSGSKKSKSPSSGQKSSMRKARPRPVPEL